MSAPRSRPTPDPPAPHAPVVRVVDATMVGHGGPARVVLSGHRDLQALADALVGRGIEATPADGRMSVTARPDLLDAALAEVADGARPSEAGAVTRAVEARLRGPDDLWTSAGILPTSQRPVVMGVLNVTPDSFSDGGHHYTGGGHPARALAAGAALLEEGADLIDVGGESTRPGAAPVDVAEELARVLPVVEGLARGGAVVSVDTSKAVVARRAVEAGAALVNDVGAGRLDEALWQTIAELDVPYVLMHMQGTPRTMQAGPSYADVVAEVFESLAAGLASLEAHGIARERVLVDPGIGFGKTRDHNLALLREIGQLTSLGPPVLVGASRKSFIGALTGVDEPRERVEGSLAAAALAVAGGARVVRAHDVRATRRAARVAHAVARAGVGPTD